MMQTIIKPSNNTVPFILNYLEEIEEGRYNKAVQDSVELLNSYNPETQTSNIPIYAGTELTYVSTGGLIMPEDTEQDDT